MLSAAIKINNLAILLKLAMPMAEWILVAALLGVLELVDKAAVKAVFSGIY